jgi:tight adherence protein C
MNLQIAVGLGSFLGLSFSLMAALVSRPSQKHLLSRLSAVKTGYEFSQQSAEVLAGKKSSAIERFQRSLRSKNKKKIQRAIMELPEILDLISVALSSGDGIYRAILRVTPRTSGVIGDQLRKVLQAVELGSSLEVEIRQLPKYLPHPQIAEFANKVSISLVRGTPLASMLKDQSVSARAEIRNRLLKQAGQNETRMLIPLVFLILPVTVLFAIYPSLKLLNLSYF